MKPLAVDTQTFSKIREINAGYVDKTHFISALLKHGAYFFLSRPRRFGKSLFVNTLKSFFQGKKELFVGTSVENYPDWQVCPVIAIDFSMLEQENAERLEKSLRLSLWFAVRENQIPIPFDELDPPGSALQKSIVALHESTGKPVVLLVDEYDSPITRWLQNPERANANREVLREFFSVVKGLDALIRFVFITGVSKFAKVSIFSAMNNMTDISLLPEYNELPGFTQQEIEENFSEHLDRMAGELEQNRSELLENLRKMYDGYNFGGTERIYNPFSLLRALHFRDLGSYWYTSGSPSFLLKELRAREIFPQDLEGRRIAAIGLDAAEIQTLAMEALLYQTGYLTITGVTRDEHRKIYRLGFPNLEVREAFFAQLLPEFTGTDAGKTQPDAADLRQFLNEGKIEKAGNILKSYVAHIPGKLHVPAEKYYQSLLYMALSLAGMKTDLERWVSTGVLDGVLELAERVYFIEFKYAKTGLAETQAQQAVTQIKTNNYALAWRENGKKLFALGFGVAGKKYAFASEAL